MSHATSIYPQATTADLALVSNALWWVREEEENYANLPDGLVDLTDIVIDKLRKAEALCWVLHGSKEYPENALAETTWVIADLIREALEAHREQWERIRQLHRRKDQGRLS